MKDSFEQRAECRRLVAPLKQSIVERLDFSLDINWIGTKCLNTMDVSSDETKEDSGWMGGVGRDVQVKVHSLLKQCCFDLTVDDRNRQVHKIGT